MDTLNFSLLASKAKNNYFRIQMMFGAKAIYKNDVLLMRKSPTEDIYYAYLHNQSDIDRFLKLQWIVSSPTTRNFKYQLNGSKLLRDKFQRFEIVTDDINSAYEILSSTASHLELNGLPVKDKCYREITITELPNISVKSARLLRSIGVKTKADLVRLNAYECFQRIKSKNPKTKMNILFSLVGAIENRHLLTYSQEELGDITLDYMSYSAPSLEF